MSSVCAGPFISQLISPPEKVQRKDGVKIELRKTTLTETLTEFWKVISNKNVCCASSEYPELC